VACPTHQELLEGKERTAGTEHELKRLDRLINLPGNELIYSTRENQNYGQDQGRIDDHLRDAVV
jgi:hypothetical protein